MKILATSTLTSKEQLTLPSAIGKLLGVRAGDSLLWTLGEDGRLMVEAGRPHTLAGVRAAVAAAGPLSRRQQPATVEDMNAGTADAVRRKHARR